MQVPDNGMSNDSVRFRLDGEALVGRLAPAPDSHYPTFPTYDLDLQRRVLELVRTRTDVPVPEVVHVELSDEWLGVPFLLMRAVEGVVPTDSPNYLMDPEGWFLQGTPEDWKRMERSTIDVLVRLHRIVDDGEATAFLRSDAPGDTALARQLADHRSYYEWARDGHTVPILERAFEMLTATIPANDRSVLNWGDARPGNIIYRDFEPAAVLDWEMARVGPPEIDVSWATFFHRFFASMGELAGLSGAGDVRPGRDGGHLRAALGRPARGPRLVRGARRLPLRDHPRPHEPAQRRLRAAAAGAGRPGRPDPVRTAPRAAARGHLTRHLSFLRRNRSHGDRFLRRTRWGSGRRS